MPVKVAVFCIVLALAGRASAQFSGCPDFRGLRATNVPDPTLNDGAQATWAPNGMPIIRYNPAVLSFLSPHARRFVYMHECGHHVLAHAIRHIPFAQEQEADCFAIVTLVRRGEFTPTDVTRLQMEIANLGPGDATHLPWPQRALNLVACLASAGVSGPVVSPPVVPRPVMPQPICRNVTEFVTRTDYVVQMQPRTVPCQHCGMTPFGPRCMHPADVVQVPVRVPMTRQFPVTRTVCN